MAIKNNFLIKSYIIAGILLPILFQYSTPIVGLTIGDTVLIFLSLILLINLNKIRIVRTLLLLIIYIFLITVLLYSINSIDGSVIIRTIRYNTYLFYIMLLPNCKNETEFACEFYKKICYLVSVIMIIQVMLLRMFDYCLPGVIQIFKLTDDSLYNYRWVIYHVNSGRCMSVFSEPSHFAVYVLPMLVLLLFKYERIRSKDVRGIVLILVSIIFASSFTGILGCACILGLWIFYNVKKGKIHYSMLILIVGLALIVTYVLSNTNAGRYILNASVFERQSGGRFIGFQYLKELQQPFFNKIVGNGMIDIGQEVYMSGWPRLIWYFGYLGSVMYIIPFLAFWKKGKISNILIILLGVMMIGTELNFGPFFVIYIGLIILLCKYNIFEMKESL